MNFGFLRLPLLTVFFPSLLLPKSSALVQSGKRECSAFSKNCQEQSALFLKIFSFFFAPFWGGPARDWRGGGAVGGAGRRRQWSGSSTPQSPAAACRRRRQRNEKKTPRKRGVRFAAGLSSALAAPIFFADFRREKRSAESKPAEGRCREGTGGLSSKCQTARLWRSQEYRKRPCTKAFLKRGPRALR